LKSRNIWKRRGTEGEKSLPQRTQRYRGNTEIQRAPQRYRGNTEIQRANRDTEERRDTEGTELTEEHRDTEDTELQRPQGR
jgi:hypothetical protein